MCPARDKDVFMTDHDMIVELYKVVVAGNGQKSLRSQIEDNQHDIEALQAAVKTRDRILWAIITPLLTANIFILVAILTHTLKLP